MEIKKEITTQKGNLENTRETENICSVAEKLDIFV